MRRPVICRAAVLLLGLLFVSRAAHAQYIQNYFTPGVPGFENELGVTVVTRVRPLYEQPGIRFGDWVIHPSLSETMGYNSNILGVQNGPGSWLIETNPSLLINSDWARNAFGIQLSADNFRYPEQTEQNQTNWQAQIGGAYTIGRGNLEMSYGHLSLNEMPNEIGAPATTSPLPYTVDEVRTDYTFDLGRLKIIPYGEFQRWTFGSATLNGVSTDFGFRDRSVYQGGVTFRYELSGVTDLLLVTQGDTSQFVKQASGQPSLSSSGGLVMTGIDYQYSGLWRYQVLFGVVARTFAASQFKTEVTPIAQANVIWTPTGLTTVTASLVRAIEDPTTEATSGYYYNTAQLRVDHEYLRNVLLNVEGGVQNAQYFGGGTQNIYYAGAGATWLLNRWMRLSAQYTYSRGRSSTTPTTTGAATFTGPYNQNLILVGVNFGL
jgi:hypothetical protein